MVGDRSLKYQPALDGLRAVAVGAVLLYHLGGRVRTDVAHGGFLGVDIFFVLSGYLITTLLLEERFATGAIRLGGFWARRARRLLPALVVLLLLVAVLACFVYPSVLRRDVLDDVPYVIGYLQNWHLALWHGSGSSPLSPAWSLSVEEQFYFLWPVVLLGLVAVLGPSRRRLFLTMVGLVVGFGIWSGYRFAVGGGLVYTATDTRAPELFVGAALAVLGTGRGLTVAARRRPWLDGVGVACLIAIAAMLVNAHFESRWFYGGFVLLAVATAVVIAAGVQPRGVVRTVLAFPVLVGIGRISYGLYLFHFPVYAWTATWRDLGPVPRHLAGLLITGVLAIASFVFVEQPVRQRRVRAAVAVPIGLGFAVLSVVAIAVVAPAAAGPAPRSRVLAYVLGKAAAETPPGRKRVLVLGGNRASLLNLSTKGVFDGAGIRGIAVGIPGCALTGTTRRCRAVTGDLAALRRTFDADAVVLMPDEQDVVDVAGGRTDARRLRAVLDGFRRDATGRLALMTVPCVSGPQTAARDELVAAMDRWASTHRVTIDTAPTTCGATGAAETAPVLWQRIAALADRAS